VFLGRFISVLRALVPAVAGDARLPYHVFLMWNAAGAILWGILHVGLGYLAGPSYHVVEKVVGKASFGVLALVVAVAVFLVIRRRLRTPTSDE
jgi:membrane protein DedA with SNARE-associated domain